MKQRRLILLVDDNPDDVELALRAFRKSAGESVIRAATDGEEALAFLFERAALGADEMPAVVLLDLKLPRLDGLDVLKRLRTDPRTRHLPVVVLSSSGEPSDIARSYALGANGFVQKPVDFDEFVEAARLLAGYWLGLNLSPTMLDGGTQ